MKNANKEKISVIMPSLNSGKFIEEAIKSCLVQDELSQIIIADGGSEDETHNILKKYSSKDSRVKWFIAKDRGPADAFNKALKVCNSEYIGWLNADDLYINGAFKRSLNMFHKFPNLKMIYGHGQFINKKGKFLEIYPTKWQDIKIEDFQSHCFICQPTIFIELKFIREFGGLNPNLKGTFDLDLWFKIFKNNKSKIGFINSLQACTRLHENTITHNKKWLVCIESINLIENNLSYCEDHWLKSAACELFLLNVTKNKLRNIFKRHNLKLSKSNIRKIEDNLTYLYAENTKAFKKKYFLNLPEMIRMLLFSRIDLIKNEYHLKKNINKLSFWLIRFGSKQYPKLFEGNKYDNEIIDWFFSKTNSRFSLIEKLIYEKFKLFRILFNKPFFFKRRIFFIRLLWIFLPYFRKLSFKKFFPERIIKYKSKNNKSDFSSITINSESKSEGVNLVGYQNHSFGIAEDLRTTFLALKEAKINTKIINFPPGDSKNSLDIKSKKNKLNIFKYNTTIICLSAEETLRFILKEGIKFTSNNYIIGYWPWELSIWPEEWKIALKYVDEIWVSSNHIKNSLKKITEKEIKVMPLCVEINNPNSFFENKKEKFLFKKFGIKKDCINILFNFDLNSSIERKNPFAVVKCFQRAFPPSLISNSQKNINLIIKTFKPKIYNRDWELLKEYVRIDPRIKIIEEDFTRKNLYNLYSICDIYLSLHRAEGYGRNLAEASILGLEVIATDYGGNTEFCHGESFHKVPYKLIPVKPDSYPHWRKQYWADPNIDSASEILIKVFNKCLSLRKNKYIMEVSNLDNIFSKEICGKRYKKRLNEIGILS